MSEKIYKQKHERNLMEGQYYYKHNLIKKIVITRVSKISYCCPIFWAEGEL